MYTAFFALSQEKQKKIINAALKEFATKGYQNASTNAIVQEACISKGSLFHYFGSKEQLLIFLFTHMISLMQDYLNDGTRYFTPDVIERWRYVSLLKLALLADYPLVFEFSMRMVQEDHPVAQNLLKKFQGSFAKDFETQLYHNIDYTLFQEGLDLPRTLKLIWWSLEGYARELQQKIISGEESFQERLPLIKEETNLYLDLLKKAYYR